MKNLASSATQIPARFGCQLPLCQAGVRVCVWDITDFCGAHSVLRIQVLDIRAYELEVMRWISYLHLERQVPNVQISEELIPLIEIQQEAENPGEFCSISQREMWIRRPQLRENGGACGKLFYERSVNWCHRPVADWVFSNQTCISYNGIFLGHNRIKLAWTLDETLIFPLRRHR